jgi:hypothetical protein
MNDETTNLDQADKAEYLPVGEHRSSHMDEFSTTSFTLDQTDEDILNYTVSDEAIEAAAGTQLQFTDPMGGWGPLCPFQKFSIAPCD